MLRRFNDQGYIHEYTNGYSSTDRSQELPGVHMVAALLKRWLAGTMHHRVSDKHLEYYLDEYAFRFNRRSSKARGLLFYRLLQQAVATDPHPLSELTAGNSAVPTVTALKQRCRSSPSSPASPPIRPRSSPTSPQRSLRYLLASNEAAAPWRPASGCGRR